MVHVIYMVDFYPLNEFADIFLMLSSELAMSKCQGKTLKGKTCKNTTSEKFCKYHLSNGDATEKLRREVVKAQKLAAKTSEFARALHLRYAELCSGAEMFIEAMKTT